MKNKSYGLLSAHAQILTQSLHGKEVKSRYISAISDQRLLWDQWTIWYRAGFQSFRENVLYSSWEK